MTDRARAEGPWLDEPEAAPSAGTAREDDRGYIYVWLGKRHPYAGKSGYQWLHRLVAAYGIGRPLMESEHVHHRNGDKADNRPQNLRILDARYHGSLHASVCLVGSGKGREKVEEVEPSGIVEAGRWKWMIAPKSWPDEAESAGQGTIETEGE